MTTLGGRESRAVRSLLEEMLREADKALYVAKTDGRNSVRVYRGNDLHQQGTG